MTAAALLILVTASACLASPSNVVRRETARLTHSERISQSSSSNAVVTLAVQYANHLQPVLSLNVIFQNGYQCTANSQTRAIQGMHQFGFAGFRVSDP